MWHRWESEEESTFNPKDEKWWLEKVAYSTNLQSRSWPCQEPRKREPLEFCPVDMIWSMAKISFTIMISNRSFSRNSSVAMPHQHSTFLKFEGNEYNVNTVGGTKIEYTGGITWDEDDGREKQAVGLREIWRMEGGRVKRSKSVVTHYYCSDAEFPAILE